MSVKLPSVLTIAGSDSGGGAGIQADLKTLAGLGCFGASAITAVTAQDTSRVYASYMLEPAFVAQQIEVVLGDFDIKVIKIGMLGNVKIAHAVAKTLRDVKIPIVLDPVVIATSGDRLLDEDAIEVIKTELFPLATIVTPNLPEAEALLGISCRSEEEMKQVAKNLSKLGPAVLIKGGHFENKNIVDVFCFENELYTFPKQKIQTHEIHGSGCALSAAIAGRLAYGDTLLEAIYFSEKYIHQAIKYSLNVGKGNKPVHHMVVIRDKAARWNGLQELQKIVSVLEHRNIYELIPEIGSNIASALPYAMTLDDIAAIEGRIVKMNRKIQACGPPGFGVSSHMARLLLSIREYDQEIRFAMNIRCSDEILKACEAAGLKGVFFSRLDEPKNLKSTEGKTLDWSVQHVMKQRSIVPNYIADKGERGKEAIIRLLAKNSVELMNMVENVYEVFLK